MPLIYSFVARQTTVLADYTAYTGNFSTVALQVGEGRGPGEPPGARSGRGLALSTRRRR